MVKMEKKANAVNKGLKENAVSRDLKESVGSKDLVGKIILLPQTQCLSRHLNQNPNLNLSRHLNQRLSLCQRLNLKTNQAVSNG
ncbi:hypothetical protein [Streptococcus equi]|uniref:hypothetical protein n=1 Tax=Streptococcus equi TaxID=1336 RepID=UPI0022ABAF33|nr:hypothetical protein [Streptococcus equi]